MWRTSRGVDDWTDTTYDDIKTLTNQKTLEDNLLDTKLPKTLAMTLDPQSAAKAFTDMLILLGDAGHSGASPQLCLVFQLKRTQQR
jgi:hypothetical protein